MTRTRISVLAAAVLVGLGLAGCGRGAAAATADSLASSDAVVTSDIVNAADVVAADPSPSTGAGRSDGARKVRPRVLLRRNTLHAEAVVQTRKGVQTVVAQRGAVTAVDDRSVTVRSTDGFMLTWSFGDPLRVVQDKKKADKSAVKVGETVGVAGFKEGTTTSARIVAVKSS